MKKFASMILSLVLLLGILPAVYADDNIQISVDGKYINFSGGGPFKDAYDRIYVPARDIVSALDGRTLWLNETQELYISKGSARFIPNNTPGDVDMLVGYSDYMIAYFKIGEPKVAYAGKKGNEDRIVRISTIDGVPQIVNDKTYLPVRYIANVLGYEVSWDEDNQTVVCTNAWRQVPIAAASTSESDAVIMDALETLFMANILSDGGKQNIYRYLNGEADAVLMQDMEKLTGLTKYAGTRKLVDGYYTSKNFGGFIATLMPADDPDQKTKELVALEGANQNIMAYVRPAVEADREFLYWYVVDVSPFGL